MTIAKGVIAQTLQINPDRIRDFQQNGNVIRVFLSDPQEILNLNVDKCKPLDEKEQEVKPNQKTNPKSQQTGWGRVLVVLGAIVALNGFGMDTTVSTEIGYVHNVGLMQEQNKKIQLGGIMFIAGIVLCCLGGKSKPQ